VIDGWLEVYERRPDGDYNLLRSSTKVTGQQFYVRGQAVGIVDSLPTESIPAKMGPQRRDGKRSVAFWQRKQPDGVQDERVASLFEDSVQRQPEHIRQTMLHADLSEVSAQRVVAQTIYGQRRLAAGTDGGLSKGYGTFGYIWANPEDREVLTSGCGEVPGQVVSMSSTRTELCGLFAALTYMRLTIAHYHIVLPREGVLALVYCNSKAALQRVQDLFFEEFGTTWRCRANYDLEAAIHICLKQVPGLHVQWNWVRGHASRRKKPEHFSMAETLNEAADELATGARDYPAANDVSHWPQQQISLAGPRGRVSGRLAQKIRYCCTASDLESYWQQRYNWSPQTAALIDIIGTEGASSGMPPARARRIQKLRCGWLPVNNRESRSDPDRLSGCSACSPASVTPETVDHLFQCESTERQRAILDRFTSFHYHFKGMKTAALITRALQTGSLAWIEGRQCLHVDVLMLPDTKLGRMIA
jgi:ribonuclease HI